MSRRRFCLRMSRASGTDLQRLRRILNGSYLSNRDKHLLRLARANERANNNDTTPTEPETQSTEGNENVVS